MSNIEIGIAKQNKGTGLNKKSYIQFGDNQKVTSRSLATMLAKIFRSLKIDEEYELFETEYYKVYRFETIINKI